MGIKHIFTTKGLKKIIRKMEKVKKEKKKTEIVFKRSLSEMEKLRARLQKRVNARRLKSFGG